MEYKLQDSQKVDDLKRESSRTLQKSQNDGFVRGNNPGPVHY